MTSDAKQRYILRALFDASREKRMHHTDRERLRALRDDFIEQQRLEDLANRRGRDPDTLRRDQLRRERGLLTAGQRILQNERISSKPLDAGLGET